MARKLAAGNWKMNGQAANLSQLEALADAIGEPGCEVLICPPATLIAQAALRVKDDPITIGAQDCHPATSGAHTGDVSAAMLADAGATHVILGHSERRADHGEGDALVAAKANAAHAAGLVAIICVGETEAERDAGQTLDVIVSQLDGSLPAGATTANTVVAYEPVWAIGTGRTASAAEIAEAHAALRDGLRRALGADGDDIPLLYGGSVKAANAAEIFAVPNVDGALVGGASLKASDFAPIVAALSAA